MSQEESSPTSQDGPSQVHPVTDLTSRPHEGQHKRFILRRDADVTGLSGTGVVAWGVLFPDGKVATRWNSAIAQTCAFDSIEDVEAIHGHQGKTRVVWLD